MSNFFSRSRLSPPPTTYQSPLAPSRYTNLPPQHSHPLSNPNNELCFIFSCGHEVQQKTSEHGYFGTLYSSTVQRLEGLCPLCTYEAKVMERGHEMNTNSLRERAERMRGKVVKWAKPGYGDEDLYETFREILRGIMREWREEIERYARQTRAQPPEKIVGPAFGKLENEMEDMLEKIGVIVLAWKDELEKDIVSREQMDWGGHERFVCRVAKSRRLRELEGIRARLKELRYKMGELEGYKSAIEWVEGEFTELGRWANCLFRGEEYVEERGSHDEGDTNDSGSD